MADSSRPGDTQLTVFHGACSTHEKSFRLTCDEMEDVRAHSGYACGICGNYGAGFVIDHDHAISPHAVRGTLCKRCNTNYMSRIDNGLYPICDRTFAYISNPWYLARRGKTLGHNPRVSVSVDELSTRDRAEVDRILARAVYRYDGQFRDHAAREMNPHFEHPGLAACIAHRDLRPVLRLLRMASDWQRPDLDISTLGPDVPGGHAIAFLATERVAR